MMTKIEAIMTVWDAELQIRVEFPLTGRAYRLPKLPNMTNLAILAGSDLKPVRVVDYNRHKGLRQLLQFWSQSLYKGELLQNRSRPYKGEGIPYKGYIGFGAIVSLTTLGHFKSLFWKDLDRS